SGSGKTTLGLAILRLISSQGKIVFLGHTITGLNFEKMRPFRHAMQVVFQDPYGSLSPRMSVSDIIEEGLWVHHPKMSKEEREKKVVRALRDVGLDSEARFRYPHEFSGGQRQRIAMARAIVLEPTFVVLDEPTSALDMLIQSQMVDLLRDLQKRLNLTYLSISHDLRVVSALASRLIVMRHGKVVEEGPAAELFARPQNDYTCALFAAAFNLETAAEGVVAEQDAATSLDPPPMSNILLAIVGWDPKGWEQRFRTLAPQHRISVWPDQVGDPAGVPYACVWHPPPGLLAGFRNLKAIFSLGAGADDLLA